MTYRARRLLAVLAAAALSVSAQNMRPFQLAATASQAVPGQIPYFGQNSASFPIASLAADVDLISVFPEHLGFPVELFLASQTPPANHAWTVQVTNLANASKAAGRPLLVQLNLSRGYMTAKAYEANGQLQLDPAWAPKCVDFTSTLGGQIGAAYVSYVRWITQLFEPKYLVVMAEVNLYYAECGGASASWNAFVNVERNAYDAAKSVRPPALVFPSFNLESLYGHSATGFDTAHYTAMANLKRDLFGISAYPVGVASNPFLLPPDYFSRVKDRYPAEKRMLLAETGWNSSSMAVSHNGSCVSPFVYSDPNFAAAYLLHVLYYAYVYDYEAVTWWSGRDLIPSNVMTTCYPPVPPGSATCGGDAWCLTVASYRAAHAPIFPASEAEFVYKIFGSMGLRTYDGTAKSNLMSWWNLFKAMPIRSGASQGARLPAPNLQLAP